MEHINKVKSFIKHYSMLDEARGVVVAVSGGADSVALLDMLTRLVAPDLLHVAHLNHQLRGQEADEDATFVRALAERLGLRATIASADMRAPAAASGRGIEETARQLRYEFLLATARTVGVDRIATGHTMTDQAETVLLRLARGAGLRGLAAMRPVTPAHQFSGTPASGDSPVVIIRPLLCLTREEVEDYCRERYLAFRTDSTNLSDDYARNRVRRDALPALRSVNPRAVENLARAAETAAAEQDALAEVTAALLEKAHIRDTAYRAAAFAEQPTALRRRMLSEAIRRAAHAGEVGLAHLKAVEGLLTEGTSGRRAELPGGLEVWREFDLLVFRTKDTGQAAEQLLNRDQPCARLAGCEIFLERGLPATARADLLEEAGRERQRQGRDWMLAILDDERLPAALTVRPRRPGERARVLGHRRARKLKNLMIDQKIPAGLRDCWPVVATPDGRYVWSPGLPPATEFAVGESARSLAILRASLAG